MKEYCVYIHISPSKKVYIGITSQVPKNRWAGGSGYKKCPRFYNAIKKYGWENFEHRILSAGLRKEEAEIEEIRLIKLFQSNDPAHGYNIENGGNCANTHSEETKRKISMANKGKTYSEETRKRMSESRKGKHTGADNSFFGKHHTEKVKKAHSEFMRGNSYNKGNHHTEEFKAKKSKQMSEKYSDGNNPRCKRVIHFVDGKKTIYKSLRDVARTFNVSASTVFNWIHKTNQSEWSYET